MGGEAVIAPPAALVCVFETRRGPRRRRARALSGARKTVVSATTGHPMGDPRGSGAVPNGTGRGIAVAVGRSAVLLGSYRVGDLE